MHKAEVIRDILKSATANIKPGESIDSTVLAHRLKIGGFQPSNLGSFMRELGFKAERRGPSSLYYREFKPSDFVVQADENGHVPTVLERLQAQVASGERNAPVQAASEERSVPAVRLPEAENTAVTEEEPRGGYTIEQAKFEMAARESPKPRCYPFESVITIRKLKGRFGNYTVFSDGNIAMEHCLNGTITTDEFLSLVEELCAVKSAANELEAMSK